MMKKDLFELSIRIKQKNSVNKELCLALLEKMIGLDRISELLENGETFFLAYDQNKKFFDKIQNQLIKNGFYKKDIKIISLKESDWKTKWKKDFQAFQLTPKIMVIPSWQKKKYVTKKCEKIYIDSTVAFGTGLHSTTKFMARLIEGKVGAFDSFLDIGTGTGILTLVALKNGAKQVKAIDIDREAVKVAKDNFVENGYKPSIIFCKNIEFLKGVKPVDFVAANLVTHDLIKYQKQILNKVKPGMFLAVSGISIQNLPLLQKTFHLLPVKILKVLKNKDWAAILYQRTI